LLVTTVGAAYSQHVQTKAAASTKGTLSGRVFAITGGGDLKPARMADVYILFAFNVTRDGKAIESEDFKADNIFMQEHLRVRA
jgi:hypothetical protein